MPSLEIRKLNKLYGDAHILHDIDLRVDAGEFVVFVGPSGCGKSTLLRMICGLDEVSSGLIAIDGEIVNDVPPAKRGIAMVFQSYALYPHMNVEQNMGYSLRLSKVPAAEITRRVARAAETLQLAEYLKRKPRHLSGGQRQRVAIGRAIVREPKIFLFDEPLSNLDAALRVEMRIEIAKLKQRLGSTMIYVTHDQVEAMTLADKIVVLNKGFVEQIGAPLDLYNSPANRFVAGFIGSPKMNFLHCAGIADDGGRLSARLSARNSVRIEPACDLPKGVEIGMRPEHLDVVSPDGADIAGTIVMIEKLGSDTYSYVDLGDGSTVLARMPGSFTPKAGDRVGLSIDSNHVHLFDSAGLALPRKLG